MITEDYVSFEIAKLLREKGFKEEYCYEYYDRNYELKHCKNIINNAVIDDGFPSEALSVAPTHQMALKWLREVHNIYIDIETCYIYYNNKENFEVTGLAYCIHTEEDPCYEDTDNFDTYEEAVEAACLYVLKNLI